MNDFLTMARQLRAMVVEQAKTLTDEEAYDIPIVFPKWKADVEYSVGDRVRYEDKLYKVLQAHSSQQGWEPTNASSLFAEILPGQDGTEIGEWVQPDSTNPYMIGDRIRFEGKIYESVIDNNVWSPRDYPYGWKEIEE